MDYIFNKREFKKGDLIESNKKQFIIIGQDYGVINIEKQKQLPFNEIDQKIIELIKHDFGIGHTNHLDQYDDFDEEPIHHCNDGNCTDLDSEILEYISDVFDKINSFGSDKKYERNWDKEYLLGFYKPIHSDSENWGIYIKANGQARRVRRLHQSVQENTSKYGNISIENCYLISKTFTFYHEYYHHKIETLAFRMEVITRESYYDNGFRCLYCKTFNTDTCLEEAFAHASSYFDCVNNLNQFLELMGITKRQLKHVLRDLIINSSPPGYRKAFQITAADDEAEFKRFEQYFFEALLRYSYKLNHGTEIVGIDESDWSIFTHSSHPFVNTDNKITYVVDFDESTLFQMRNLFGI